MYNFGTGGYYLAEARNLGAKWVLGPRGSTRVGLPTQVAKLERLACPHRSLSWLLGLSWHLRASLGLQGSSVFNAIRELPKRSHDVALGRRTTTRKWYKSPFRLGRDSLLLLSLSALFFSFLRSPFLWSPAPSVMLLLISVIAFRKSMHYMLRCSSSDPTTRSPLS
ncbi:hypothetical protein BHE74_00033164 [Ensete ventricosum]|nr:hypothetical protein BHE74_00033164 [Ensete ventricosum]